MGEEAVLADSGRAGEKAVFLSIQRECYPLVPQVRSIEFLACQNSSSPSLLDGSVRDEMQRSVAEHDAVVGWGERQPECEKD